MRCADSRSRQPATGSLLAVPAIGGMAVVGPRRSHRPARGTTHHPCRHLDPDARQRPARALLPPADGRTGPGPARRCRWRLVARPQCHDRLRRTVGHPAALLQDQLHSGQPWASASGGPAGSVVDVLRPGTVVAIYLGNTLSFLAPLCGASRTPSRGERQGRPPGQRAGRPTHKDVIPGHTWTFCVTVRGCPSLR
jgi:hypothetical protein